MFQDKIYTPKREDFGVLAAVNGWGARADFVNSAGERNLNLTPNSASSNFHLNLVGKTATNLTRTNLRTPGVAFGQNERVNLTANEANSGGFPSGEFKENSGQNGANANLSAQAEFKNGEFKCEGEIRQTRELDANLTQIKTVDIHSHLLSSDVKFDRFYDKLALAFFAKKFDINRRELIKNGFEGYKSNFARLIKSSNFVQKSVVFGVDAKFDESGNLVHKDKTVCASNEDVFAFYEQNPNEVVPFFSVNPNRKDALNLIEKYHKMGFKGGKLLHSYWETDLNDKRYEPYFRLLSELGLPLVIHVGDENSLASNKALESIEQLKSPLNLGCRIVCAHMGASSDGVLSMFSRDPEKLGANYFTLLRWLREFDGLYADVSALLCINKARILPHLKTQTQIHDKILFGTDFPVPFSVILSSYDLPFRERLALNRIQNPLDRYVRAMSLYFGEDSPIFSNYKKILGEI
ncbi:MAG: amidohydrolase family protein [Campylobacter sp.]